MSRTSPHPFIATLVALVVAWAPTTAPAGATAQHAAGLVIDTGERVVTVYVEFSEETITGEELLRRADVDAVFADYGSQGKAVCSILGVGSPEEDCFREAEQNGTYWNYSRAEGGDWQRSSRGVSSTTVEHGDVDGWAWGPSGSEPPYYSFEEIRQQHAPEPSPSPSPTPSDNEPDPTPTAQETTPDGRTEASSPPPVETSTPTEAAGTTPPPEEPTTIALPSSSATDDAEGDTEDATEPSPSPTSDRVVATTAADSETPYRTLGWVLFVVVIAGLAGGILWRRRTGTQGDGIER